MTDQPTTILQLTDLIYQASTQRNVLITGLTLGMGGREISGATDLLARGARDLAQTYRSIPDFDLISRRKSDDPAAQGILINAVKRAEREARYR